MTEIDTNVDADPTRVYFGIESDLLPDEVSAALGVEPTSVRRSRIVLIDQERTLWHLDLASGTVTVRVVEQAGERLLEYGPEFARAVASLTNGSSSIAALVIVQHITTDTRTTGIQIERPVIEWLAEANAFVTIDQYVWM